MNKYRVYSKDGRVERCRLTKVEYSGTFMGDRVVTSSFTSATEIAFDVFDYIEFRGEKFELEMIPTVKKVSSYQYEYDLRFVSLKYELERCMFRDFVPNDNEVVYPTPVTVEFTGKVNYLTERIQACLDRMYGAGVWSIVVSDGVDSEEKNLSLSNQNCWNALSLVNTEYKLNFHINGRTVVVGDSEAVQGVVFEYGKGNGLYEIERAADSDTGIVTKLIAYGGTRNLDYSYPKKPEWSDSVLPNTFILSPLRLMLPSFKKDGKTDYLLADDALIAKYGIREGVMMYDDIYPTITGATNSKGERIDKIAGVDAITDEETSEFDVYLNDLGFDLNDSLTTETPQLVMKTGALQGYSFNIKTIGALSNGGVRVTLEKNSIDNSDTGGYYIPNKDFNMSAGDEFVLLGILMPQLYIRNAEQRLEERAREYLNQYSTTNYSYSIGVDEIFMAKNPSVMAEVFEGKKMKINDDEIGINEELVTIQTLTIEDGDGLIPRIKVTLNNNPSASTLERIQGQIANIESTANSQYSAQTELAKQYQRKLNTSYFHRLFVAIDANGKEIAPNDTTTPIASVRVNYGLWTEQFLSAKGMNSGGGSSEGGATTLGGLRNVSADANKTFDVAKMLVLEADSNLWTLKNLSELVGGLDEAELAEYLTNNNYAKKGDIPSLEGYATEQWVLGKGYATTTDLDNRIDALVNGAPQAYDTLKEIADVLANNINSIDDILTALGTKVSKDDFNTAIANVNKSISDLNTELDLKLDAVTFTELFEKVQLEDGTWAIKAKLGLFSDGFISAKGSNVGGTSSEGGAVTLYQLNDVLADGTGVSGAQHGAVFVYDATLGKWKGVAQSEIVPNLTGYAKESWVLSQGFLTQHQDLSEYAKLTDIPTIPTTDINKGVIAYGWGDHSKVGYLTSHQSLDEYVNEIATSGNGNAITSVSKSGKKITFTKGATYLTGITSKLVTDALGYTPYDSANFTQANIKSTLGISDWALASSKPSYTTKEVAEDTNLYFTNARAVAALKSITDGLSGNISTLQGYFTDGVANSALRLSDSGSYTAWGQTFFTNGKPKSVSGALTGVTDIASSGTITTNKIVIGNGTIEWDETNKGFKIVGGLYTESYLSTKGANTNGGSSSGGGLIESLWKIGDLGKTFNANANDTFNAYAINAIHNRVSVLEGKATNVSFTQSLTSGTQIGTITIDGASKNIYAPTIPTSLKNPYALTFGSKTYDGSAAKTITAADLGALTGITSSQVTSALGFTPYNASNPSGYTSNNGTVTSVSVKMNNTNKGTVTSSGTIDLGTVITAHQSLAGYATESWVTGKGYITSSALDGYVNDFTTSGSGNVVTAVSKSGKTLTFTKGITALTSHQTIYGLTIQKNGTSLGTYTPNSDEKIINISVPTALSELGADSTHRLVTDTQISTWNGKQSAISDLSTIRSNASNGATAYGWGNHASVGYLTSASSLAWGKITGKPTTISGYGITDAITTANIGSQSVASATKLTTARTIWGQSFDGTGNVSGAAMGLGGAIDFQFTDEINRYGGNLYIQHRGDGSQTGTVSGVTGNVVMCKNGGNVLIGTSTDSGYKLDVSGTLHASGAVSFDSTLSVTSTSKLMGNVGIGVAADDNKLCVYGVVRSAAYNAIGNNNAAFVFDKPGSNYTGIGANGVADTIYFGACNVTGAWVTSYYQKWHFNGEVYAKTGIWSDGYVSAKGQNTSSDMRLKNVLNDVVLNVSDIANAPSIRFAWKKGGGIDVGSSAQYWQGVLPDAVKERNELEMQYGNIALLSAIAIAKRSESHEERITSHEERIARLEKENMELRNEINILRYGE